MKIDSNMRTIDKIIEKLGDLPSAPTILSKAIKLTSDIDSNITDISKSIFADQSLSAKVIHLSNSPIYGRSKRVSCLEEAIKVLGFNQLKSIIITASTFQMFENCLHADVATDLWHHSFSTAIGSRMIAKRLTKLDSDEAYLAGLLHDIGKLILLKTAPNVYSELIESVKNEKAQFVVKEQKELDFDHTDLGKELLNKWDFSNNISIAVGNHHKCNLAKPIPIEELTRVVALADSISCYIGAGFYESCDVKIGEEFYLGPDRIDGEELIIIRCDIESEFNSELSLLYD